MASLTSASILSASKRIVVKIGSALLVDGETGQLREDWLAGLCEDVAKMKSDGKDVLVVSSGSIALGRGVLGLSAEALSLDQSQAAAAVGQIRLARAYESALAPHDIKAAQVLVTLEDSADRRRYLNSRATLATLLGLGVIPIVNENDTIATDEIRFGDNDRLAAQVAVLTGADTLVLLSDIDGLYDDLPTMPGANHIPLVEAITPEIEAVAGDSANAQAKGGMKTKIWAARTATNAGCAVIISEGRPLNPLRAIQSGAKSTVFAANSNPAQARKRWINGMKARGEIVIDLGAANALRSGKSLLPAGVKDVKGDFNRGDPVDILDEDGHHVARALAGYDGDEARKIAGVHSGEIAKILGHEGRSALIHRDDMAL